MSQFTHSVRTGQSATEHVFGMPDFEYMKLHPEEAKLFNDAMRSHS